MQESPDYTMDEFDEINPFGDEFRPDSDSPFYNYSIKDLKKARDEIYAKRRVTKESLSKRLQEGKQRLKSTPPRKREIPPTYLETSLKEAVESRRPSLDPPSDGDEDFFPEEQNWETEGSGIADEAEKLIDQLHLCLGSIKAGNSSIKLKKSGIVSA